ncbi:TPA: phospho-sugar glycosidase domain-containing protein [Enterococcus faecium]
MLHFIIFVKKRVAIPVGSISQEELLLLDFIKPWSKFKFLD